MTDTDGRIDRQRTERGSSSDSSTSSMARGVLISLSFWGCLLLSGLGFAASTLSVRCAENHRLLVRFTAGEAEQRQLMEQVGRYEQYCESLARSSGNVRPMGEATRSMPLESSLTFQLDKPARKQVPARATPELPPLIDSLSRSMSARWGLLAASVVVLVFAFVMLIESDGSRQRRPQRELLLRGPVSRRLRRIGSRYRSASG